jgi:hypothetical protein
MLGTVFLSALVSPASALELKIQLAIAKRIGAVVAVNIDRRLELAAVGDVRDIRHCGLSLVQTCASERGFDRIFGA